ncbi:hypothetical protein DSECCO2_575890 [anaerobic digester metagenome]
MLFPSLQGECISPFPFFIQSTANDAAWHLTGHIKLGGKESKERAAHVHAIAQSLSFTHHDICIVLSRRIEDGQGDGIHAGDHKAFGLAMRDF